MASSASLKDYLKRYQSGDDDKRRKKKSAKSKPASLGAGVLIVYEDPPWQKPLTLEEPVDSDSVGEDNPVVDEDIEVKRLRRLEEVRARKPYLSVSEDGSGWVSVSDVKGGYLLHGGRKDTPSPERDPGPPDLSPPRLRNRTRSHRPSPEGDGDSSPRKGRTGPPEREAARPTDVRHDYPGVGCSPPRQRRRNADDLDLSPDRDVHGESPKSDLSPPRRTRRSTPELDISPQRRAPKGSSKTELPDSPDAADISPPQRVRRRSPESDVSPPRRFRRSPGSDHSPVRRTHKKSVGSDIPLPRQARRNSPGSDLSPVRGTLKRSPKEDFSPPRLARRSSPGSDLSPPRRAGKGFAGPDLSSPRRARGNSRNADVSLPQCRRDDSPEGDLSPPRKGRRVSADGSQRHMKTGMRSQEPVITDTSPPRAWGNNTELDPAFNQAVEHSTQGGSDVKQLLNEGKRKGGLYTGSQIREEINKKKAENLARFELLDPTKRGKGAEPVYRHQGKKVSKEEKLKLQKGEEKPKENNLEWGKGLAQKREAEAKALEIELEKERPFARTRDDPELDKMLKDRVRWGDPVAHLVKRSDPYFDLKDFGGNGKMKESGFIVPQTIPDHSWIKRGLDPPPNRYGIKPGRHWDGVDRSTGYEKELFKRQNEKRVTQTEAYLWSVADM